MVTHLQLPLLRIRAESDGRQKACSFPVGHKVGFGGEWLSLNSENRTCSAPGELSTEITMNFAAMNSEQTQKVMAGKGVGEVSKDEIHQLQLYRQLR